MDLNFDILGHPGLTNTDQFVYHLVQKLGSVKAVAQALKKEPSTIYKSVRKLRAAGFDPVDPVTQESGTGDTPSGTESTGVEQSPQESGTGDTDSGLCDTKVEQSPQGLTRGRLPLKDLTKVKSVPPLAPPQTPQEQEPDESQTDPPACSEPPLLTAEDHPELAVVLKGRPCAYLDLPEAYRRAFEPLWLRLQGDEDLAFPAAFAVDLHAQHGPQRPIEALDRFAVAGGLSTLSNPARWRGYLLRVVEDYTPPARAAPDAVDESNADQYDAYMATANERLDAILDAQEAEGNLP